MHKKLIFALRVVHWIMFAAIIARLAYYVGRPEFYVVAIQSVILWPDAFLFRILALIALAIIRKLIGRQSAAINEQP